MLDSDQILTVLVVIVLAATMYIRVELDFKRNAFRIVGHSIATILLLLTLIFVLGRVPASVVLWWLLASSVYLFINEVIRVYLRKHKMEDILQNHPRLYWLARGKIRQRRNADRDTSL